MIARRLIALSVVIICLTGAVVTAVFYRHVSQVIQELVERRGKILLQAVAKQALESMHKGDFDAGLEGVVRSLQQDPDVSIVIVIDGEGTVLSHSESSKKGGKMFLSLWDQDVLKSATPMIRYDKENARYIIGMAIQGPRSYEQDGVSLSLPSGDSGFSLGAIYVGLSAEKIKAQIQRTMNFIVVSLGAIVIAATIALIIFTKKFLKPLQSLNEATGQLAGGNLEARVDITSEDEVGMLARSFNVMTRRLRETMVSKNQLQAIVDQKTKALKDTNLTLLETNMQLKNIHEMETRFISMASHELRTPMTSISGFVSLMQKYYDRLSKEQMVGYLETISSETARLARMINEILDLKRIQQGRIELHSSRVDLKILAEKVVEELKVRPNQPNYSVFFEDGSLFAMVDEDKVKQIFINLLSNAAKYTPAGKLVIIEGILAGDKAVAINVRDEGSGIPKDLWVKLFHPFARANDEVARKTVGSGLGLAITKSLIEAMGGRIRAENIKTGAQFTVIIPRGNVDEAPAAATVAAQEGSKKVVS